MLEQVIQSVRHCPRVLDQRRFCIAPWYLRTLHMVSSAGETAQSARSRSAIRSSRLRTLEGRREGGQVGQVAVVLPGVPVEITALRIPDDGVGPLRQVEGREALRFPVQSGGGRPGLKCDAVGRREQRRAHPPER